MRPIILIAILALPDGTRANASPGFSKFPAPVWSGIPAPAINLDSHPDAGRFRTVLRKAYGQGANFDGKFTIASWGCGTSCTVIAVIDQSNGKVFFPKSVPFVSWAGWWHKDYGLSFRKNSRLLKVSGQIAGHGDFGRYTFEWTGQDFKLIHKIAAAPGNPE